MFGHGLSKGVDIDGNHFNGEYSVYLINKTDLFSNLIIPFLFLPCLSLDLAIGAPNAESVYVYKSYPVVRLNVSVAPLSQEIKTTDKSLKMMACWSYNAPHAIDFPIGEFFKLENANLIDFDHPYSCAIWFH